MGIKRHVQKPGYHCQSEGTWMTQQMLSSQHSSSSMSQTSNPSQSSGRQVPRSSRPWKGRVALPRNKNILLWSPTEFCYTSMILCSFPHPHSKDNKFLEWWKSSMLLRGILLYAEKSLIFRKSRKKFTGITSCSRNLSLPAIFHYKNYRVFILKLQNYLELLLSDLVAMIIKSLFSLSLEWDNLDFAKWFHICSIFITSTLTQKRS